MHQSVVGVRVLELRFTTTLGELDRYPPQLTQAMKPEYQAILAPYASTIFKSNLGFHETANLLTQELFAGIYFGEDEWHDEFGPFVGLVRPFLGFTVEFWPQDKDKDDYLFLCMKGKTGYIPTDPEFDAPVPDLDLNAPPAPEYDAATKSLDFSWYIARQVICLDNIYDAHEWDLSWNQHKRGE